MLPVKVAAVLLFAIWGVISLMWFVVFPYWEKKATTEARKREIEAKRGQKRDIVITAWEAVGRIIFIGLPALFIVDGLILRMGLFYSARLSFFNPFDGYIQIAGLVLALVGLVIMVVAGRPIMEHVYAKATEERKMMTTGIYAYIRHPLYLSLILIPVGLLLLTLNYVALLLLPALWISGSSEEEWGDLAKGKRFAFLTTAIEYEEQELLRRFGKDYEEYMKRTGRLLPKIRG